jgi:hypothetical protein
MRGGVDGAGLVARISRGYSVDFKRSAVRLTQIPRVEVQVVADALDSPSGAAARVSRALH